MSVARRGALALLGVAVPMVLGFGVGYLLVSETSADWQVPAFLGATLCATSVGITARVLKDLGRSRDRESKIILGAAVIDDVLGLVVLAVVFILAEAACVPLTHATNPSSYFMRSRPPIRLAVDGILNATRM